MFSCTTSFYELLQTFYWSQSHKLDYYDITNGVIGYHQVAPRRDPACIGGPACIRDPASIWDPACIRSFMVAYIAELDMIYDKTNT